jgi:putative lipoprotein
MARATENTDQLRGTTWLVTEVRGHPIGPGSSLTFGTQGDLTGTGGINRLRGSWSSTATSVHVGPLAVTRMAGPPELMAQEASVLEALQGDLSMALRGDQLTLGTLTLRRERPARVVQGTVGYRERRALPADAVVTVTVSDVSQDDAPARVIGQQRINGASGVPVPFRIEVPTGSIDPRQTYSLSARITVDGALRWITDTHVPVLTRGAPDGADLVLVAMPPGPER